jgi:hypothetical protein
MRTWKARAAVLATATALVTGVGGAHAVGPSAARGSQVHVRKFVAVRVVREHQLGGTWFVASDVERHHGRVVGTDSVTGYFYSARRVHYTRVAAAWKYGIVVFKLKQGPHATGASGRIIRGTGGYSGIQGYVASHPLTPTSAAYTVTYTLR